MPSSYTPLLRLTLPADGELVGTWGQTVNNGITSLEEAAIAGTANVGLVDVDYVMSTANGAADVARNAVVRFTGALTAQRNITVPSSSKTYIIRNATTGGFGLNVKTAAGTGVVVPFGGSMMVYCDGVNVLEAVNTAGSIGLDGTPDLILKSSGTEKMRINAAGNVGIGVAPSAWGASYRALQVGYVALFSHSSGLSSAHATNGFYDGAAWRYMTAQPAISYEQNTGAHVFSNAVAGVAGNPITFVERMRIDAAGNVGVGTTVGGLLARMRVQEESTTFIGYQVFSSRNVGIKQTTLISGLSQNATQESVSIRYEHDSASNLKGSLLFYTTTTANVPTERMRITDVGQLLVNTSTSLGGVNAAVTASQNGRQYSYVSQGNSNAGAHFIFLDAVTGGVGSISSNNVATTYSTTSDYRLKESIEDLTDVGDIIDRLQPRTFVWKADGTRGRGFIAHEFAEVSPGSVSGTQDGEQMQMLDASTPETMAVIVAELKSLRQRLAALEATS